VKKRLEWLDMGKGIGMVLVIFAHDHIPTQLKAFIYTFHMPLFFFLSGYLFSPTKYQRFSEFFTSKFKSLIIPYFSFSMIVYVWFLFRYRIGDIDYTGSLLKPLIGTIMGERNTDMTVHIGALWFLTCLFTTELLFYLIKMGLKRNLFVVISIISSSIIGYLYSRSSGAPLLWNFDAASIAVLFFGVGYMYKELTEQISRFVTIKVLLIVSLLNLMTGYFNYQLSGERVDMYESQYGNYLLFVLSAFSGIIAFLIAVQKLGTNVVFQYIGKNSLIYLALHQSIVFSLLDMVFKRLLDTDSVVIGLFLGTIYTIITIIVIAPVAYVIKNDFPYILGKSGLTRRQITRPKV